MSAAPSPLCPDPTWWNVVSCPCPAPHRAHPFSSGLSSEFTSSERPFCPLCLSLPAGLGSSLGGSCLHCAWPGLCSSRSSSSWVTATSQQTGSFLEEGAALRGLAGPGAIQQELRKWVGDWRSICTASRPEVQGGGGVGSPECTCHFSALLWPHLQG